MSIKMCEPDIKDTFDEYGNKTGIKAVFPTREIEIMKGRRVRQGGSVLSSPLLLQTSARYPCMKYAG